MNVAALTIPVPTRLWGALPFFYALQDGYFYNIFVSDCGTGSLLISIDDTFAPFSS